MPGRRALAFCVSIRHSQHVTEAFRAAGIAAAHIDGTTPDAARRRVIRDFADGRVKVLSNVELVTTGFDLSSQVGREVPVEGAIMLRPTQSLTLWIQMVGRALRRKSEPAIILDHAGGSLRHGLPDDARQWSLEGRKKGSKKAQDVMVDAISHCPECFAIFRAGGACPVCGHQLEVKGRLPEEQEGELREIDPEEHRKKRAMTAAQRQRKTEEYRATAGKDRVDMLESLTRIAVERDYKVGWAARKYTFRKTGKFDHPDLEKVREKEAEIRARIEAERGAA
jgi:superfamily II DNA or RNA helicase